MALQYKFNVFTGNFDLVDDGSGATTLQVTDTFDCAASLNVGEWVYQTTTDNFVERADASTDSTKYSIGIVISKPTTITATILLVGTVTGLSTSFSAGSPIFLAEVAGTATQTPVTTSGSWLQILGVATSATSMAVRPGVPLKRG